MLQDQIKKDEQLVFNLIEEYLENNRYLNSNDLISFLNSRFAKSSINISNDGIKLILKELFKKKLIVERSKLTKKDVLLNYNRKHIYEIIKKNPGIHFNKIVKVLDMNNSMVAWHLNILLNFQFIKKKKIENFEAYFDLSINNEKFNIIHLISRVKYKRIIEFLKENKKGCTKYLISKELGMHPNTISKYFDNLEKYGLLNIRKMNYKTIFSLNEDVYKDLIYDK